MTHAPAQPDNGESTERRTDGEQPGPLTGVRFVELGGIGPVPHAAMMLADMGAQGVRIDRPGGQFLGPDPSRDSLLRGRVTRTCDLASEAGRAEVLDLVASADVLIEGYQPGVAERLGVGPAQCWERNPALVYGRMTGWGQTGPWARLPGHDINYSGLAGTLRHTSRPGQRPVPALNLIADHGGGSTYLVMGVLAGLLEASRTGHGVVVDAAMVDGAANLMSLVHGLRVQGLWPNPPGENLLDGGSPFYDTYECADGRYVAVGPLEPRFYAEMLAVLELDPEELPRQYDQAGWPQLRQVLTDRFSRAPRDHWARLFADRPACVTPVLDMDEAALHPHLQARGTFITDPTSGGTVPGPAPRFGPRNSQSGQAPREEAGSILRNVTWAGQSAGQSTEQSSGQMAGPTWEAGEWG